MSWPTDGRPRFVVRSITGWPISASAPRVRPHDRPTTSYMVLDRAYGHHVLAEFARRGKGAAEQLAALLNEPATEPQGWTLVRRLCADRDDRKNVLNRLSEQRRQALPPTAATRGEAVSSTEGTEPSSC